MSSKITKDRAEALILAVAKESASRWMNDMADRLVDDLRHANAVCASPIEVAFYLAWVTRLHEYLIKGSPHGGWATSLTGLPGTLPPPIGEPAKLQWHTGLLQYDLMQTQYPVPPYRADFALQRVVRDEQPDGTSSISASGIVIVECDGHDFHDRTPEQAARDKRRDRDFASDGHVVLRFTGRELLHDPASCANEVDQLLEQQIAIDVRRRNEPATGSR